MQFMFKSKKPKSKINLNSKQIVWQKTFNTYFVFEQKFKQILIRFPSSTVMIYLQIHINMYV